MKTIFGAVVSFFAPVAAFAADPLSNIVPCDGPFCSVCDLVQLGDNILKFGVAFSAIGATLMFVWAGVLYVTAAADKGNIDKAHNIFWNAFWGLVIILSAWLIVNAIMSVFYEGKRPWNSIDPAQCAKSEGTVNRPVDSTKASPSGSLKRCGGATSGLCSSQNLSAFGNRATDASKVCLAESGGRAAISDTGSGDKTKDGKAFSIGLFQINFSANTQLPPECDNLNCSGAFEGKNFNATVKDEALYLKCRQALEKPSCNIAMAKKIYDGRGGRFSPDWTAARTCSVD